MKKLFSTKTRSWDVILSILGIAAALSALAAALYLSRNVNRALDQLQNEYSISRVASVLQALDQNALHLGEYTSGYAMWDDAFRYLETRDPAFIEVNYSESVLAATPVQLVGIYDLKGELIFSDSLTEGRELEPPPKELKDLSRLENFSQLKAPGDVLNRVEWIGQRPYIVAICPITDSSGTQPIRGYLLSGEIIDQKMLDRLHTLTGSKVTPTIEDEIPHGDFQVATTDLGLAEVTMERQGNIWVSKAFALFREDNKEQRSVGFRIDLPATASQTGRALSEMIRTAFLLVAAAFALFVALAIYEIFHRRSEIARRTRESDEKETARQEASDLADEAAAADRAKSAFLAMISHEIRTPLNAIVGYADLLRHNPEDELPERLEIIARSGTLLQRIVDDILDFSKIEAGKLDIQTRAIDLRALITEVVRTFERAAELRGDTITVQIAESLPEYLLLDDIRIKQVLGNLVSNAVKFTNGGSIAISVHYEIAAAGRPAQSGQMLAITVEDEGVGVAKEEEAALFEPFSQADTTASRRYQGTGLGLVICRRLCTLMGGTIIFRRRPTKGSAFEVKIPAPPTLRPSPDIQDELAAPALQKDDLSILIVDDNAVNGRLLKSILKRMGRSADTALSGKKAIEHFRAKPTDVIFMDIHMPGMDGMTATREIRRVEAELKRTPCVIIAVTADSLVTDSKQTQASGMDGHLNKPIRITEISDALSRVSKGKL